MKLRTKARALLSDSFVTALERYVDSLEEKPSNTERNVPTPQVIKLIGRLNAVCARNMRATDWFPVE